MTKKVRYKRYSPLACTCVLTGHLHVDEFDLIRVLGANFGQLLGGPTKAITQRFLPLVHWSAPSDAGIPSNITVARCRFVSLNFNLFP